MKRFLASLALVLVAGSMAYAGMWNNVFPIIGGSSYSCGSVNGVSNCTVPAGPALTGLESVPADTNLTQGQNPQTAIVPIRALGAGALQYNVPVTTDSITISPGVNQLIVEPAGTIAALTVVFPAASTGLYNNQRIGICGTQIVTTLTITAGSGTTVSGSPTAMLVPVTTGGASCPEWVYRSANTTWYRVH